CSGRTLRSATPRGGDPRISDRTGIDTAAWRGRAARTRLCARLHPGGRTGLAYADIFESTVAGRRNAARGWHGVVVVAVRGHARALGRAGHRYVVRTQYRRSRGRSACRVLRRVRGWPCLRRHEERAAEARHELDGRKALVANLDAMAAQLAD